MTESTLTQTVLKQHNQRRQALFVLILGLLIAVVAIFIAIRDRTEVGEAPAGLVQEHGVFPVTSLFGIDNSAAQPDAGHTAPNFAFHLPDGTMATLADYKGQPVMINFWATWCGPCRLEMPDLVRTYETHKDDGLVIIEINSAEAHEPVSEFVKEFGMTMPVLIDARREVMSEYKTQSLPSTFFIDREGNVQVRWIGFLTSDVLKAQLDKIL